MPAFMDCVVQVFLVLSCATCYTSENSLCLRVDAELSVLVTAWKGDKSISEKNVDTMKFHSGSCEASHAILILNCTLGQDTMFRYSFEREGDAVMLLYSFSFFPTDVFHGLPDMKDYMYYGFASPERKVGTVESSYKCDRKQTIQLVKNYQPNETANYNFSVQLNIKKIHAQAFNMKNSTFSPAVYCPAEASNPSPSIAVVVIVIVLVVLLASATAAVVVVLHRNRAKKPACETSCRIA